MHALYNQVMHLHILGICGTFMGGLAALARQAGHQVTGCDSGVYPPMSDQLRAMGIDLIEGYGADQLALKPDIFVVGNVVSRARGADGSPKFPLMEAVLDSGARYSSGPQWLAEHVLQGRPVLAVAGTHGKTTTTSMLAWILECAGLAPGFLVGGVPLNFGVSARLGAPGSPFVIEADEYDTAFFDKRSKFVHYRPRLALLNNLEFDHADIFDDLAAIERQFHHLVRTVPPSGTVLTPQADAAIGRVLAQGLWSRHAQFGLQAGPGVWAHGEPHRFELRTGAAPAVGATPATVNWALSGLHNQLNAAAAAAAALTLGVNLPQSAAALNSFTHVRRRQELRGTVRGVHVYDDFAHHPTAIAATLDGMRRRMAPGERLLAVFEPRSNTMKLGTMKAALPQSLQAADLAFCHTGGLDWDAASALAPLGERAATAGSVEELVRIVAKQARTGDHIVCMSNGGFGGIHERLLGALAEAAAPT